jgi:hypothetical protein
MLKSTKIVTMRCSINKIYTILPLGSLKEYLLQVQDAPQNTYKGQL